MDVESVALYCKNGCFGRKPCRNGSWRKAGTPALLEWILQISVVAVLLLHISCSPRRAEAQSWSEGACEISQKQGINKSAPRA